MQISERRPSNTEPVHQESGHYPPAVSPLHSLVHKHDKVSSVSSSALVDKSCIGNPTPYMALNRLGHVFGEPRCEVAANPPNPPTDWKNAAADSRARASPLDLIRSHYVSRITRAREEARERNWVVKAMDRGKMVGYHSR